MADITIYGAGIFGLSTAFTCLRRGARVTVIDPNGPGAGASGGIVGALAPHVPENWNDKKAFQLDSLLMAAAFWADVAQVSGQDPGYARSGRLQPIADDHALALARQREGTARALWGDHAVWQVIEATAPFAPLTRTGLLVHDTLSARLHPRRACAALAAAIITLGGTISPADTQHGTVLHATGAAGLVEMSAHLPRAIGTGVKGQAALLDFAAPDQPQLFADTLHIIPHADGTTAIGSTSENSYDDPTATDAQLDAIIARARAAVPALADAPVIARWAGLRPRARSRAPMLGAHPLRESEYIANGGFKIGFGMAPKVAQVMTDLMLEGRNDIPEGFRPQASL